MNFQKLYGTLDQIIDEAVATDETVVVYTVPAGKKFDLVEAMLVTDAGATGTGSVEIRSPADAHIRHLCHMDVRENNKGVVPADHFQPCYPLTLTAGQDIAVVSDSASLEAQCDIFGFESDA